MANKKKKKATEQEMFIKAFRKANRELEMQRNDGKWVATHRIWKNKKAYLAAWEGVVYFSRTIHKDTVDIIAPIYLKAVKNINWLEGEVGHGFIDLYLTLLIFAVDKPTKQFIPEFYKSSSEENRKRFVSSIGYRLRTDQTVRDTFKVSLFLFTKVTPHVMLMPPRLPPVYG